MKLLEAKVFSVLPFYVDLGPILINSSKRHVTFFPITSYDQDLLSKFLNQWCLKFPLFYNKIDLPDSFVSFKGISSSIPKPFKLKFNKEFNFDYKELKKNIINLRYISFYYLKSSEISLSKYLFEYLLCNNYKLYYRSNKKFIKTNIRDIKLVLNGINK